MAPAELLHVEVVYCPQPGIAQVVPLRLSAGTTLAEAVQQSGLMPEHGLAPETVKVGVWSRVRDMQSELRDLDRVEIYRALQVDPKEARRQRYKRQKAR